MRHYCRGKGNDGFWYDGYYIKMNNNSHYIFSEYNDNKLLMFDYGVDCCDCCKYKKKCDGKPCEYNSMTTNVEIIKDWLESNYD